MPSKFWSKSGAYRMVWQAR